MVHYCVVRGCDSTWSPDSAIRYHPFPQKLKQRKLWLSMVPLKEKYHYKVRICSLHFQETDYNPDTRRLLPTAIPLPFVIIDQERTPPEEVARLKKIEEENCEKRILEILQKAKDDNEKLGGSFEPPPQIVYAEPLTKNKSVQCMKTTPHEKSLHREIVFLRRKVSRQNKKIMEMVRLIQTIKMYTSNTGITRAIKEHFDEICTEFKTDKREPHLLLIVKE